MTSPTPGPSVPTWVWPILAFITAIAGLIAAILAVNDLGRDLGDGIWEGIIAASVFGVCLVSIRRWVSHLETENHEHDERG